LDIVTACYLGVDVKSRKRSPRLSLKLHLNFTPSSCTCPIYAQRDRSTSLSIFHVPLFLLRSARIDIELISRNSPCPEGLPISTILTNAFYLKTLKTNPSLSTLLCSPSTNHSVTGHSLIGSVAPDQSLSRRRYQPFLGVLSSL
jgi:hypothetical protein